MRSTSLKDRLVRLVVLCSLHAWCFMPLLAASQGTGSKESKPGWVWGCRRSWSREMLGYEVR